MMRIVLFFTSFLMVNLGYGKEPALNNNLEKMAQEAQSGSGEFTKELKVKKDENLECEESNAAPLSKEAELQQSGSSARGKKTCTRKIWNSDSQKK